MNRLLALTAAVAAVGLLLAAVAAVAAPVVAIYDYNAQKEVKPKAVFLTADAGPYVRHLHWTGWGTDQAVGHGQYVSSCASCAPPRLRKATITLTGLHGCKKAGGLAYEHGTLQTGADETGKPKTFSFDTGYTFTCVKYGPYGPPDR